MKLIKEPPDTCPPATAAEIVAIEFSAIKEARALTKEARLKRVNDGIAALHSAVTMAFEIVALDKEDLIERVRERYDVYEPLLGHLSGMQDTVKAFDEAIRSAEARLTVALALVESK